MSTILSAPQQYPVSAEESSADWKRQLAERLDAYRAKHSEADSPTRPSHAVRGDSRASEIARSVASRYASVPTYEELLQAAVQAERAAAEAQAALAERVANDARLQQEQETAESAGDVRRFTADESSEASGSNESADGDHSSPIGSYTPVMPRIAERAQEIHLHQEAVEPEPSREEFWKSALFEPRTLLPSKLIEFPRELVSSRRAKLPPPEVPHHVETKTEVPDLQPSQLRIFEAGSPSIAQGAPEPEVVDPAPHSMEDEVEATAGVEDREPPAPSRPMKFENTALAGMKRSDRKSTGQFVPSRPMDPESRRVSLGAGSQASAARAFRSLEWAAISLDEQPAVAVPETRVAEAIPFLTDAASIDRRLMALAVDFCVVTAGFFAFLMLFAVTTTHFPTGVTALALGGVVYACIWLLYQVLFFSLGGSTAGMLYARIALCTFDDRNPTRLVLRHRLAAWWLSLLPAGIGFLWSFFDEDNLSWHDRMTRTYQREY